MNNLIAILSLFVIISGSVGANNSINKDDKLFKDGATVVFLGDSITHGGWFIAHISSFYATRFPGKTITFKNCGIAGDSANGASRRLDWDLYSKSPSVVAIMFGMNDVRRNLYGFDKNGKEISDLEILSQRKMAIDRYKNKMTELLKAFKAKDLDLMIMTPTPYDQEVEVARENLYGVNDALQQCAAFCKEQTVKFGAHLVDFNYPMLEMNRKLQKTNPSESLIGKDRVHPHQVGQLPLLPELCARLVVYLEPLTKPDSDRLFPLWKDRGAEMLHVDLLAAGVEIDNSEGKLDFHSLRHTCATRMALAGVSPQLTKKIMRHSSINLTMRLYSHTVLQDRASALEKIPDIAINEQNDHATGTE